MYTTNWKNIMYTTHWKNIMYTSYWENIMYKHNLNNVMYTISSLDPNICLYIQSQPQLWKNSCCGGKTQISKGKQL
jgi:hypothetical protein